MTTVELDNLAAETAATMTTKHPDYAILAARIAVSNLHKETKKSFSGRLLIKLTSGNLLKISNKLTTIQLVFLKNSLLFRFFFFL